MVQSNLVPLESPAFTFTESKVKQLCVKQKDYIFSLIMNECYHEATAALEAVKIFWEEFDYGFKYHELAASIAMRSIEDRR